ncbi:acyltransferase family protein [Acidiphilium sp.]|uniref:acyltransferase family protein n=1 Tax=Acidiphilium sp. TaxID=527 RepID=UPI003CFF4D22
MSARLHLAPAERPLGRLTRLDGLRGVLAVYVMLGHTAPFIPWPPLLGRVIEACVSHGLAAVDLFFALSGLVIVQSMARFQGRAMPFLAARARRLLPVYFAVLALAIIGLAWRSPFAVMPWLHPGDLGHDIWTAGLPRPFAAHLLLHLVLLQGVTPHGLLPDVQFSLLGPAWSLSTEWQFYLVIAVLAPLLGTDRRGLHRLVWICLAVAIIARLYAGSMPPLWRFHRAFLPDEAAYFAIGIAAARLWRGPGGLGLFSVAVVIATLIGASHGSGLGMSGMIGKAMPPLIWVAAVMAQRHPTVAPIRPLAALLDHPAVLWLGAISYPLYLVNEPVGRFLAVLTGAATRGNGLWFGLIWGPLTLVGSIAAAALLHYTIERRFMRARTSRTARPLALIEAPDRI